MSRLLALFPMRERGPLEQLDEVDVHPREREAPRLEAGEVEQVADQPLEPRRLGRDHRVGRLALGLALDDAVGERPDVPLDRGQRRAQLVRDAHQEVGVRAPSYV